MADDEPDGFQPTMEELRDRLGEADVDRLAARFEGSYLSSPDEIRDRLDDRDEQALFNRLNEMVTPSPSAERDRELRAAIGRRAESALQEDAADWSRKVLRRAIPGMAEDYVRLSSSGSYKNVYLEDKEEGQRHIVYMPKQEGSFDDRMAQVLTWKRNAEQLHARGIDTAADHYDILVTEIDGEPYPVMVGAYSADMQLLDDVDPETREEIGDEAETVAYTIQDMVRNGDFISAEQNDYTGGRARENLGYEEGKGVVVVDLGELSDLYFKDLGGDQAWTGPYDSRDDYLETTGLRDRIEEFRERTGMPPSDEYESQA